MPLMEIELHPEKGQLRVFGLALAMILAVLAWRLHWTIGIAAAVAAGVTVVFPMGLRWIYVVMMIVPYPLGMALSCVALAAIYYGVITPLGWLARLCGRDALGLHSRRQAPTYWVKRKAPGTHESYFHQW